MGMIGIKNKTLMMLKKILKQYDLTIFLVILLLQIINPQTVSDEEINNQFNRALSLYKSGNYVEALAGFNNVIIDYKYNSRTTVSELFKAKSQLELKQYNQFKSTADQFLILYPTSNYIDELRMLLTRYNLEIANYYNAFREVLFIIDQTNSSGYEQKARVVGEGISAKYLNDSQLEKLGSTITSSKVESFILLQMGKFYIRNNNPTGARRSFEEIINDYPQSIESIEAKRLIDNSYSTVSDNTVIGVMLPLHTGLSGSDASQPASEILEGIKFAVDEFNKMRDDKIGLLIRDTKKNDEEIEKIKEEFVTLNSLLAVIGPIFSNEVRTALDDFDEFDIPIISPTATDDDLTSLSHNFFQANPPFSVRGRIMAQYIFFVENKRTISVMNSIEGYSPILASSFINEFENLGGRIVKKETFKNDYTDFSGPISKIYSDSLLIEGIYIPLSDNSVTPFIFSELIKYGVKIPIFGNQDWFTAKGFETAAQISNNLVFESDYFVDFNSEAYKLFNDQFSKITQKDVNRNVLYGYDAARYILTAYRNSEPGRKNLVNKMISGMVSSGLRNNISFDERRVNKFLNIVRYKDGVFELVDKFRLSQ
jgi:branched-chain amino acid transport system substrate-binding protein